MDSLEAVLHYSFHDPGLLLTALTHSSYANEHRDRKPNERLEFLGDAVLELSVSTYLYRNYPKEAEGVLSRRRASLVCEPALAACARKLDLGSRLFLGKGEEKGGGREKDSLLADLFEAVIGAIYLDGGFEAADGFIRHHVIDSFDPGRVMPDAKTRLQEYLQKDGEILIEYRQQEEEKQGERCFYAEVLADGRLLGSGTGHNKKQAEQRAAQAALDQLQKESPLA